MNKMPTRFIGKTQLQVTELGFGAASMGNLYHEVSDEDAAATMSAALSTGLTYFDTAPHYGQGLSERRVGDTLRPLKGKTYVLSTKVGRLLKPAGYADSRHAFLSPMPFDIHYDYTYEGIMRSYEDSLQRLGLDRIDILFVHDIGVVTHGEENEAHFSDLETSGYKALDELRSAGDVTAIGLGVNEWEVCEDALEHGDYDCFLLAGRYTLLEQEAMNSFVPKCVDRGATLIIGGPYNSGILATGTRKGRTLYYNYEDAPPDIVARVQQIESVCGAFGVTLAAAALQFPLAHPVVSSVIPGLGNPKRVAQTMSLYEEVIPADFWSELKSRGLVRNDAPVP